jgi:hypothetical protein
MAEHTKSDLPWMFCGEAFLVDIQKGESDDVILLEVIRSRQMAGEALVIFREPIHPLMLLGKEKQYSDLLWEIYLKDLDIAAKKLLPVIEKKLKQPKKVAKLKPKKKT